MRYVCALLAVAVVLAATLKADAREPRRWRPEQLSQYYTWHGGYYHSEYGAPVALVVPPTAHQRTEWGWGVGNTRIRRIDHQFSRPYPGPGAGMGTGFYPTPPWPSDTTQFGVHYVRGPW